MKTASVLSPYKKHLHTITADKKKVVFGIGAPHSQPHSKTTANAVRLLLATHALERVQARSQSMALAIFWLGVGQGSVSALVRVSETRPCPNGKATIWTFPYPFLQVREHFSYYSISKQFRSGLSMKVAIFA